MGEKAKVYRAANIITLDENTPRATHVAVVGGRIAAVGGGELERQYSPADTAFEDAVLVPGFVEGHAHIMEGAIWKMPYVGFYDRIHPCGQRIKGCDSAGALVSRLKKLEAELADENETLFAWGYDAIYFADKPMRRDLDRVSATRPVVLFHSNLHLITVNSAALRRANITRDNVIDGVYVDAQGEPNGELAEFAAMFPVFRAVGNPVFGDTENARDIRLFGKSCHRAGITTAADLFNNLEDETVATFDAVTREADFPVRIAPALSAMQLSAEQIIARAKKLGRHEKFGNDKLHFGAVKIITDGTIQGYSARVRKPYINGVKNGVWFDAPSRIQECIRSFHAHGIKIHIHVNGDEAAELALQTFEEAVSEHGRKKRHVLQHAQMMDADQLARAAKLGLMVNFFANHTWFWGDQHREATVGPDLAPRMNAARTAIDAGLDISIHCDAPVSPMSPLFTAWCAVNRKTASGRDHGPAERITAAEALRAVTLGGAMSLDLEHIVGSISPGKFADFTVLAADPLGVEPMAIRDIEVLGTVLGGRRQPAEPPA